VPDKHIDSRLVRMASRRTWGKLLDAGVAIYEYEKTMMHNKMLIIDDLLVSVGSTNFDMRSFNLNDEASLNVYSSAFGPAMTQIMQNDLRGATRFTFEQWKNRPMHQKIGEIVVRPVESQL
jgi:cardiolipin synthase